MGNSFSGDGWNPQTWRYNYGLKYTDLKSGLSYKGGMYIDQNGMGINKTLGGTSGDLPLYLPNGIKIEDYADVSWSLSGDIQIMNWEQILCTVGMVAATALITIFVVDNVTPLGALDDGLIVLLLEYIASISPSLYEWITNIVPKLSTCGG